MRFVFKTRYEQHIALARHNGHAFWCGLLGVQLAAAPWLIEAYWLAPPAFMLIYGIAGRG